MQIGEGILSGPIFLSYTFYIYLNVQLYACYFNSGGTYDHFTMVHGVDTISGNQLHWSVRNCTDQPSGHHLGLGVREGQRRLQPYCVWHQVKEQKSLQITLDIYHQRSMILMKHCYFSHPKYRAALYQKFPALACQPSAEESGSVASGATTACEEKPSA